SSGKDKGPTQEYILLPLQPHRTRIPVEDVPNRGGSGQKAKERSQTTYHTSQSLDEDNIGKEDFSEEKGGIQGVCIQQGRKSVKSFKGELSVHKDPAFDDLDDFVDVDDTLDYMESEDAQDEGGQALWYGGTDSTKVSTDRQCEGTADQNEGKSVTQIAPTSTSTPTTPTPTVFGDDETIAQVLIIMCQNKEKLKEKEKGVEIRNIKDTERPRPTLTRSILTLRPLPKIDPKDKGKKRIKEEDESDTESEEITKSEKKFKQLANDEEVARKVQEEQEAEEEKKRLDEEEAIKAALSNEYDFIQARLNADKILAEKLQEEEREMSFDEIQVLYENIKRSDDSFIDIGSAQDEKVIKEMNEQAADASKKSVKKDDNVKGEIKAKKGTKKRKSGHVKMIARKRLRPQPDDDSDEEHRKCLRIVTFEGTIDSEIIETKSFIARYGYIRNHMKTVKNGQARKRESEEYKKKPKIQSRSQKVKPSVKMVKPVKNGQQKVNQ
ncbi:hypothetical protein Tco_1323815, partial [Tanacetum coccineum]